MYDSNAAPPPLNDLGTLLVRVSTAGVFVPVEGASVRISGEEAGNESIHYYLTTDQSGLTERVQLPTPSPLLSQAPNNPKGFSQYRIEVYKDGFYPIAFFDVPLFPGITSVQAAELIPKPPFNPEEYPPRVQLEIREEEPLYDEEVR